MTMNPEATLIRLVTQMKRRFYIGYSALICIYDFFLFYHSLNNVTSAATVQ